LAVGGGLVGVAVIIALLAFFLITIAYCILVIIKNEENTYPIPQCKAGIIINL
jgi:hypothetical protein